MRRRSATGARDCQAASVSGSVWRAPFSGIRRCSSSTSPNANLDQVGEAALAAAVAELKSRGAALMIVGHRPSTLAQADTILFLRDGRVELFGAREDVLGKLRVAAGEASRIVVPQRDVEAAPPRMPRVTEMAAE